MTEYKCRNHFCSNRVDKEGDACEIHLAMIRQKEREQPRRDPTMDGYDWMIFIVVTAIALLVAWFTYNHPPRG